jgi:8-oxo-dGTP diphosphatase
MAVTVVCAAILDGHRLLGARRTEPAALAGGWELPGGKVEAGESDIAALVRECHEELGVGIAVGRRIGGDWAMSGDALLRAFVATVARGTPAALEDHSEVRWLEWGRWWDVAWLAVDVPVVRELEREMG